MTDEKRAKEIFQEALDLPKASRAAHLDAACEGDAPLRARVEKLLEAAAEVGDFLAQPTGASAASSEGPGTSIGPYKLLQEIGEGGFGVVYMAEQTGELRRKVALKIIKLGMDTKQVVARFEAERQALALMDHPHIAKVLDAGATESGRPYFVMELVRGVAITQYCNKARLDTKARLGLFRQVCHAVQHAHQKGIIHRDLKPSNVLVTLHDGVPVPKVIDFGIAKATDRHLTEKTLFTEFHQWIGTPDYMAPEQAELSGLDIDTRADIYSLGVLLYELLTGTKPFDLKSLMESGYDEILRTIREVDPPTPSSRISTMGDQLAAVARQRHTPPRLLGKLLRGELDWIVMKALEKDRQRRYETATALAQDVARYLADEPVRAIPPRAGYRLAKFVKRNRVVVSVAATLVTALLLSGGLAFAGMREARKERDAENEAQVEAATAKAAADAATERAREQRERAEKGAERARKEKAEAEVTLSFIRRMLGGVALGAPVRGPNYKVRDLLEDFDRGLDDELKDQPELEAYLRREMGKAYLGLGMPADAERHLERALELRKRELGDEHELVAELLCDLSRHAGDRARYEESEQAARSALRIYTTRYGADHERTSTAQLQLADTLATRGRFKEARDECVTALQRLRARGHAQHVRIVPALVVLAFIETNTANDDRARALLDEAEAIVVREHGPEHPKLSDILRSLSILDQSASDFASAESRARRAVRIARETFGESHPRYAYGLNNLGILLGRKGEHTEAGDCLERAHEIFRRVGDTNSVVRVTANLAAHHGSLGHLQLAFELQQQALETARSELGEEHPTTHEATGRMAGQLRARGEFSEAEEYATEALQAARDTHGDSHPGVAEALGTLARIWLATGQFEKANGALEEALAIDRATTGEESRMVAIRLNTLGSLRSQQGAPLAAVAAYEQSIAIYRRLFGERHSQVALGLYNVGVAKWRLGQPDEAKKLYDEALEIALETVGDEHEITLAAKAGIANLLRLTDPHRAEQLQREILAVRQRILPEDHPEVAAAMNDLGTLLANNGEIDEGLALVRNAVAIWCDKYAPDHPRIGLVQYNFGTRDMSTTLRHRFFEFSEQPPASPSPAQRLPALAG